MRATSIIRSPAPSCSRSGSATARSAPELTTRGASCQGLDIAPGPVDILSHRWRLAGGDDAEQRIVRGSVLGLPSASARFDYVFTIGGLHHTGNLPRAVVQVRRVLRPGGTVVVMLYTLVPATRQRRPSGAAAAPRRAPPFDVAALYDTNAARDAAPYTDYASPSKIRRLFAGFSSLEIDRRNFDSLPYVPRRLLLGTLDRVFGLDLYITARR